MQKCGKKILNFILLIFFIFCGACEKFVTWDNFTLSRANYSGHQLKIDGYFYQYDESMEKLKYCRLYCFYRNGILLNIDGAFESKLEMDNYVLNTFINDQRYKEQKSCWGLFVIDSLNIKFERYYVSDDFNKRSYVREGKIISDTLFHIKTTYRSDGSDKRETNEFYYFRSFSPKPDSTNSFLN